MIGSGTSIQLPRECHDMGWKIVSMLLDGLPSARLDDVRLAFGEALANIGKHSTTGTAYISVSPGQREIVIDMADDGPGFLLDNVPAPDDLSEHGRGLVLIRQLFGQWAVVSTPGLGTVVTLRIATAEVQDAGNLLAGQAGGGQEMPDSSL